MKIPKRLYVVIGQDACGEPYAEAHLTKREAQTEAKRDIDGGCFATVKVYVTEKECEEKR